MPAPQLTGTPPILRFGGQALPNGQGTMPYISLNDLVSWFWQDIKADHDYLQHGMQSVAFAAKAVYVSTDVKGRVLSLPMRYAENVQSLGAALAPLSQSGEQLLTIDNVTGIPVRFQAGRNRTLVKKYSPYYWDLALEFVAKSAYFQDLTAATLAPVAVLGSVSPGTSTPFTITYSGGVFCDTVFTFTVPVGNGVVINSLVLTNTTSGEALTIAFQGGLLATTAYSIVIDSGALTVKNGTTQIDFGGSFPHLYPSGQVATSQVNSFTAVIVTASGTTTGCTVGASWTPRWEF